MKAIVQNYLKGSLSLDEIPVPGPRAGFVLVRNHYSLISLGTERSVIEFGRKTLLEKVLARPAHLRRALQRAQIEGYWKIFQEGRNRLDQDKILGYSSAGVVVDIGPEVTDFAVGDHVACMGSDFASHAEYVCVPRLLSAKIPEGVALDQAAFGMVASIAMHGIRQGSLEIGSKVAVIGLGLIGLIAVQILKAYGCYVEVLDLDESKVNLAKTFGADAAAGSNKDVFDAVFLCVATSSHEPLTQAVELCRAGGTVVLIGVADIKFARQDLWEKEVKFVVSKAAGPGTMDPLYEWEGLDYPEQYVPWTQQRNMQEVLRLLQAKKLDFSPLISHRFELQEALRAYDLVQGNQVKEIGGQRPIGIILQYPDAIKNSSSLSSQVSKKFESAPSSGQFRLGSSVKLGFIGGGVFTRTVLLPEFLKVGGFDLGSVATASGLSAKHLAKKFGFKSASSNYEEVLGDPDINAVFITTRHGLHAELVCRALAAKKWVFVEKPMAINEEGLNNICHAVREHGARLMVGYNRRYSQLTRELVQGLKSGKSPMHLTMTIHPGPLPANHWVYNPLEGGGRVLSEVCHYIDWSCFVTDSRVVRVQSVSLSDQGANAQDNVSIVLDFANGSRCGILYSVWSSLHGFRERYEILTKNQHDIVQDFKSFQRRSSGRLHRRRLWAQDMGYQGEMKEFLEHVRENKPFDHEFIQYEHGMRVCFAINESLSKGSPVTLS